MAGARWLGVTCASEGARVRQALEAAGQDADRRADILLMCGFLPDDVPTLLEHRLTPVLWTAEQVRSLPAGAAVHVEVDTGMGRQGVTAGPELDALLDQIAAARLQLEGLFTHFCSSEQAHSALTRLQQTRFEGARGSGRHAWAQARMDTCRQQLDGR